MLLMIFNTAAYSSTTVLAITSPDSIVHFSVRNRRTFSSLSLSSIVGDKKYFNLKKVDPDFTDSKGDY
jgi:hypothetical protein